jgi:hypothetical protein
MPSHTFHVVQAFAERDGGIVPVEPKAARPQAPPVRWLPRLAPTHAGVIAWARTGDPELNWDSARTGVIPEMNIEAGGGVARSAHVRLPV